MKAITCSLFILLSILNSSCIIEGSGGTCEQNLAGVYMGKQTTPTFLTPSVKTVTLTISGTEGDYRVSAEPDSALREEELEQDGCGFDYRTGPVGNKITGEVTIVGDSIWYKTSGDNFGVFPTRFSGIRQ